MAKPAKAPDPAPPSGEGHNIIGVTQADFDAFSARHSRDTAAVKLAQAQRNKTRKGMRAAGIILGVFDRTEKLADMSHAEQQTEMLHTEAYLRWHRAPIGTQFTLSIVSNDAFDDDDDEAAEARVIEDAKGAGWRAGLAGEWQDVNPYEVPSDAGQAWLKAWHEGQEKNAEALAGDADSGS